MICLFRDPRLLSHDRRPLHRSNQTIHKFLGQIVNFMKNHRADTSIQSDRTNSSYDHARHVRIKNINFSIFVLIDSQWRHFSSIIKINIDILIKSILDNTCIHTPQMNTNWWYDLIRIMNYIYVYKIWLPESWRDNFHEHIFKIGM